MSKNKKKNGITSINREGSSFEMNVTISGQKETWFYERVEHSDGGVSFIQLGREFA
jgi:hypothetical protein